ncbi:hypothetical protein M422DRAFT_42596 [Sphaerobolus stellatus SS14]|nr:hypothetical protein M422DRAFT_42596 [Sphaerobolus stellatus SS14]
MNPDLTLQDLFLNISGYDWESDSEMDEADDSESNDSESNSDSESNDESIDRKNHGRKDLSKIRDFLELAHWPHLRRLTITAATASYIEWDGAKFRNFLQRHSKLEALSLSILRPSMWTNGSLSHLRSLDFSSWSDEMEAYPSIPREIAHQIEHFLSEIRNDSDLDFLKNMPSLRTTDLHHGRGHTDIKKNKKAQAKVLQEARQEIQIKAKNAAIETLTLRPLFYLKKLKYLGGILIYKGLEIDTYSEAKIARPTKTF